MLSLPIERPTGGSMITWQNKPRDEIREPIGLISDPLVWLAH